MKIARVSILLVALLCSACVSVGPGHDSYALSVRKDGIVVYGPASFPLPEMTFEVKGVACQNAPGIPLSFHIRAEEATEGLLYYYCSSNCFSILSGELSSVRILPGKTVALQCAGGDGSPLLVTRLH
jgi:hypothetical protein